MLSASENPATRNCRRSRQAKTSLLIDPGVGTAPKPGAGPSSSQVPPVALDESRSTVNKARRAVHGFLESSWFDRRDRPVLAGCGRVMPRVNGGRATARAASDAVCYSGVDTG